MNNMEIANRNVSTLLLSFLLLVEENDLEVNNDSVE